MTKPRQIPDSRSGARARRDLPIVHRWPFLALVVATLAGVIVASAPAVAAATVPTPVCDWQAEYARTIAEMHEDPALFHVLPRIAVAEKVGGPALGSADREDASVAVDTPCELVSSVVRHEHMHLQQYRLWGGLAAARAVYGDWFEVIADCASMLAGSQYTPYVDRVGGCSPRDLADARQLLPPLRVG